MNAIFLGVQLIMGLVTYAVFVDCDPIKNGEINANDQLFAHVVMRIFGGIPAVRGLFLSTIFAAALRQVVVLLIWQYLITIASN